MDRSALLHLKEVQGGDFEYAVFDRQTKEKTAEGTITADAIGEEIEPPQGFLSAARALAVREAGLDGFEAAQVGLTSLARFPASDIYRRTIWEPETLPKDDIRFINSGYDEQFRIPDGGTIQVEYPDRTFSAKCEYIDDCHTYIGSEIYHICQFAEILERGGAVCRPEPELEAEQAAWKIGQRTYLAVECGAGHWDYHLYDEQFNETKSGELEVVGCSINEVRDMKAMRGERFTVKQMEKTRKSLQARLEQLASNEKKDDVVTFEQLGVDRLFVDESQAYKNLFLQTKMRNVAGLSTSEAQRSSDLFMKCRYMDELTGGKGTVFATGTPVSNSMTELYTMMRYLQYEMLRQKGLTHFDQWASTFGETTTAIELAPEGYTFFRWKKYIPLNL